MADITRPFKGQSKYITRFPEHPHQDPPEYEEEDLDAEAEEMERRHETRRRGE